MKDFRRTLEDCLLEDIGFSGPWFTWERGRILDRNIRERIDRCVATDSWSQIFPNYSLRHLLHSFSDHCPLLAETEDGRRRSNTPHFCFESWWVLEDSCEKEVKKLWEDSSGPYLNRMKSLTQGLKAWVDRMKFSHKGTAHRLNRRIEELNDEERSKETLVELMEVKLHLNMEMDKEERYWEQRARVNWLQMGDKNTSFFHKYASQRRRINRIRGLQRSDGSIATDESEIEEIARVYFSTLFESKGVGDMEHILSGINACISDGMNQSMLNPYTEAEIIEALNGMGPTKASGSDGFPAIIYQKFWHIVGKDTTDFCLNIIAKAVANRLQKVLDVCIDDSQSAFVPGRLITDNVLLAYEAYDRVEWPFIKGVMARMGFADGFIDLIFRCISSVQYSILSNGEEGSSFRSTRGLQQGDPLSPYLFLFCGEKLSVLMRLAGQENMIKDVKVSREAPSITHLMFADDCILFGDVSNRGINVLKEIIREYEVCSGQCVNFEKSTVLFSSNVTDQERNVSQWTAKGLLLKGLGWRIGDGQKVSIWEDRWVPGDEILNCQNLSQNPSLVKVAELIDNNTRRWNEELILRTFAERDAERILSIPLSMRSHEDFLIWREEATGEYSVRSGHRVLVQGRHTQIHENLKIFYKSLWSLELPSKLKITAWRSMCNYLPNFSNLHFRRIMGHVNCRRCQTEPDTREHLFRNCPVAKETWEKLGMRWSVSEKTTEFTAWVIDVFENNSLLVCRTFVCALWGIWTSRNKFIHEGENQSGGQIADFTTNYLKEIDGSKQLLPVRSTHATRWKAPRETCMRINFDAAFNKQNREACSRLVVRNGRAEVICSKAIVNKNIPSTFAAEALACYQAIDLGVQLGLREVEIEGDSRTVIQKIQEKTEDRSKISAEANMVAHLIATEGIKKGENTYLLQGVPPIAVKAMAVDRAGMENV
ncbi:reverse transcriptase [Gossypium australe]|uniref:Reverse transcriptase n=1 Tax=Gossypium australe TaxID=47621 RepID=A0A5B6V3A3_9ROSI|nr:reverse transcriptase [Gossypium australe]